MLGKKNLLQSPPKFCAWEPLLHMYFLFCIKLLIEALKAYMKCINLRCIIKCTADSLKKKKKKEEEHPVLITSSALCNAHHPVTPSLWLWFTFSLMTNAMEHLFMCLLNICMSSLETCIFGSSFQFWIIGVLWYILVLYPYQMHDL